MQKEKKLSLHELDNKINGILDKCLEYFNANPNIRDLIARYQKLTFLAFTQGPIKHNNSGLSDDQLRDFLRKYENDFKTPIKNLLVEYYRVLFNPDLKFEGPLLESLGFNACRHCLQ